MEVANKIQNLCDGNIVAALLLSLDNKSFTIIRQCLIEIAQLLVISK
jgi:hypothetical protein